jgi:hypothetical protein
VKADDGSSNTDDPGNALMTFRSTAALREQSGEAMLVKWSAAMFKESPGLTIFLSIVKTDDFVV